MVSKNFQEKYMKLAFPFLFTLLPCLIVFSCGNLNTDGDSGFAAFKTERAAWENNPAGDYYLTLTHEIGLARYTTASLVKNGIPEYVETGGASVTLTDNFPFPPPAETIGGIYALLEEAFSADSPPSVEFDIQSHTPKRVRIKNYEGSGQDYLLFVVSFAPQTGGEDNLDVEEFDIARLKTEKEAWEAQNIQNYRFIGALHLDYPSVPVWVAISPDAAPVLECPPGFSASEFEQAEKDDMFFAKTIVEIYSAIESNIKDALDYVGANPNAGVKIQIAYNAEYHYPEFFSENLYDRPSGEVKDGGGWSFEITGFERLDMDRKTDVVNFDIERFQNEKAAWEAQDLAAYRFTAKMLLDYPVVPVRITVKDTGESEIEPIAHDDFTEPDLEMAALYGKTISDIYASIEADIRKERNTPRNEHQG
jgi:hypothetical protein